VQLRGGAGLQVLRHLRQRAGVGRAAAAFVLGAATTVLLTPPLADVARAKPFWLDEGFEIAEACRHSYLSLLIKGAPGQCSPSPLYYLAQRLSVRSLDRFDEGIAVTYRRVSLIAAGLLLFATTLALHSRLGAPWALAAAATLASQPAFARYAAESRPYMSWLLLFALTVIAAAQAGSRPWRETRRGGRAALAVSAVALSLVALPGALQAALACLLCGLAWRRRAEDPGESRAALRWSLLLAAACVAAGLYFGARSPCREYDAGPLAFHWPDRTGRAGPVLALLWGDGIAGQIGNALLALGLVAALRPAAPRGLAAERARHEGFASWLARGVAAQLALTVLLAVQVALVGYYFLDRVFLHLVVCRALLVAAGGWWLMRWLEQRAAPPTRSALQALASGLAVFAAAMAFLTLRARAEGAPAALPPAGEAPCPALGGTLVLDRPADTKDWALGPNLIMRLAEDRHRCGTGPAGGTRHVLAAGDGVYHLSADRAPGAIPLEQCGRPVVLEPGGVSGAPPRPPLASSAAPK
jgi:hypothetical protein